MDGQQPRKNNDYNGRFGSAADASRRRPTGSYRSSPSGSYRSRVGYGDVQREAPRSAGSYSQRPKAAQPAPREEVNAPRRSARGGGDAYTRRPEPRREEKKGAPNAKRADEGRSNESRNVETRRRVLRGVLIVLILALLALTVTTLVRVAGEKEHHMPTIERIGGQQ